MQAMLGEDDPSHDRQPPALPGFPQHSDGFPALVAACGNAEKRETGSHFFIVGFSG
jgi:hypothetical protein